jgi:4-hydroxy 2-oxovalerate aldolase
MKTIDVTLRDGGFVNDFNWDIDVARKHIEVMSSLGIHLIEIGYWKQTAKSKNPFYCVDENLIERLNPSNIGMTQFSAMIDYHYCSKKLSDYPMVGNTALDFIRITSRREDFEDALQFAKSLHEHTGLYISFQIINVSNYTLNSLLKRVAQLADQPGIEMVGFADSHGNLNMAKSIGDYEKVFKVLDESGMKWGFHLHNHTGRAVLNYWILSQTRCSYIDFSVRGLGKGAGNLRAEDVIRNEDMPELLDYLISNNYDFLSMSKREAYCILTGRTGVTDNYARLGIEENVSVFDFYKIIKRIAGVQKDSFSPDYFIEIKNRLSLRK